MLIYTILVRIISLQKNLISKKSTYKIDVGFDHKLDLLKKAEKLNFTTKQFTEMPTIFLIFKMKHSPYFFKYFILA